MNQVQRRNFILVHQFSKYVEYVVGKDLETGKQVEIETSRKSAFLVDINSILSAEEEIDAESLIPNDFYCKLTYVKTSKNGTEEIVVAHLVETVEDVYRKICEVQK